MGNRATIIFTANGDISPAVYLHWNGGPESVYQFLDELDRRHVRADADYECARFVHIVGDFFDQDTTDGLSLGVANGPDAITPAALRHVRTDHGDNGFYIVDRTKQPRAIRRFHEHYDWDNPDEERRVTITEDKPENVTAEANRAARHSYRTKDGGFAALFTKMRPNTAD